jgi:hypothetical protein
MSNLPEVISLSDDILYGAAEIAKFLFNDARERRRVYHLASRKTFPHFRLAAQLCARKSKLIAWISEQENNGRYFEELQELRGNGTMKFA